MVNASANQRTKKWFVASIQGGKEVLACRHLRNQGFDVFFPKRPKTVRHARRVVTLQGPLFPGYIFVSFAPGAAAWRAINGTIGVRHLLCAADRPLALPSGFVEGMEAICDRDGVISFASELRIGERVQLLSGPFADRYGKLESLDSRGRVCVLLELLSSSVPAGARAENLFPV